MARQKYKNNNIFDRATYAVEGILAALRNERSFRAQVIFAAIILVLLIATRPAPIWWAVLLLTCGCSLATELVNTAVETLADHLHPDIHPSLKIVKDTLSGAVLVIVCTTCALVAAFLWSLIYP